MGLSLCTLGGTWHLLGATVTAFFLSQVTEWRSVFIAFQAPGFSVHVFKDGKNATALLPRNMQVSQRFEVDKDGKNATALLPRNIQVSQRYEVNKDGKNA